MGKYIIDIDEKNICSDDNGSQLAISVKVNDASAIFCTEIPLTPYTEPDMEQVRKEAYEQGLSDAWEAARKVTQVRKYGGYGDCLEEVFGRHRVPWDVFDYSASEAIEKIRQYEQEKEEQIQIGDEIETPSGLKGYVVNFTDDELVHYVSSEGRFGTMGTSTVSKTGRHFPEIAEVLQKMKES